MAEKAKKKRSEKNMRNTIYKDSGKHLHRTNILGMERGLFLF